MAQLVHLEPEGLVVLGLVERVDLDYFQVVAGVHDQGEVADRDQVEQGLLEHLVEEEDRLSLAEGADHHVLEGEGYFKLGQPELRALAVVGCPYLAEEVRLRQAQLECLYQVGEECLFPEPEER